MTLIDKTKTFYEGDFADVTVTVPANTTLNEGCVLGRNKDKELVAFTTDNNVEGVAADGDTPAVEAFNTEPIYILAETLPNTTAAKATFKARVLDGGVINEDKIIFAKAADKNDVLVQDQLRKNGFKLVKVQNLAE